METACTYKPPSELNLMNINEVQKTKTISENDQGLAPSPRLEPISTVSPEPATEEQDGATMLSMDIEAASASPSVGTDQNDEQQLNRALHLSRSTGGITNTVLESWTLTFQELCEEFQDLPEIGEKDGSYLVRGPVKEGESTRSDANIEYASVVVWDGDSSLDPQTGEITEGAPDPSFLPSEINCLQIL